MFRIAICDDDNIICNRIDQIIFDYGQKNKILIETEVFYSGENLCKYLDSENGFDLIFLDIEMMKMSGIDVGLKIRKERMDYDTKIVYITGTSQYTRQLLDLNPLLYIEKPFTEEAIIETVELALRLTNQLEGAFHFKIKNTNFKLKYSDILYFESMLRKILLVTQNGRFEFYGNLNELADQLPEYFVQIHRSYIINTKMIKAFLGNSVLMQNDVEIAVSQTYRSKLKEVEKMELQSRGLLK